MMMASISLIFLLLSALLDFGYSLSTAPIKIRKGRSLPPEMNVSPASTLVPRRGVLSTIVASAASLAVPKISLADAQIEALPFQVGIECGTPKPSKILTSAHEAAKISSRHLSTLAHLP